MKKILLRSVDEIIDALIEGRIIYPTNGTTRYWVYKGLVCMAEQDDDEAVPTINAHIDVNQDFYYYG